VMMASVAPAHRARRLACPWRVVVGRHGVGRGRPQRAIYCAIVAKEIGARRPGYGRRPASPPHPVSPRSARADGGTAPGMGKGGGAVGNQECQESVMRFARDAWSCDARRALGGVWRRHTRWARSQGTNIAKSLLKAGACTSENLSFIATECCREREVSNLEAAAAKIPTARARAAFFYAVSCSTEARLRHNNDISQ